VEKTVRPTAELLARLKGGLIVSCQADPGTPLDRSGFMAALARAAQLGGAAGIRANGPEDIAEIHRTVDLPLIGLWKVDLAGFAVRITPTVDHALQVAAAGADIIALDATDRPHPDGQTLADRISTIHAQTGKPILADVSNFHEAKMAEAAGADLVATTLAGYTGSDPHMEGPDLELVERLSTELNIPVIAEGHIGTPEQASLALHRGAFAVVVGSAITRPGWITEQFVRRIKKKDSYQ
jgi:N-acylglucosamine-6-phosphate 2-epimerase